MNANGFPETPTEYAARALERAAERPEPVASAIFCITDCLHKMTEDYLYRQKGKETKKGRKEMAGCVARLAAELTRLADQMTK